MLPLWSTKTHFLSVFELQSKAVFKLCYLIISVIRNHVVSPPSPPGLLSTLAHILSLCLPVLLSSSTAVWPPRWLNGSATSESSSTSRWSASPARRSARLWPGGENSTCYCCWTQCNPRRDSSGGDLSKGDTSNTYDSWILRVQRMGWISKVFHVIECVRPSDPGRAHLVWAERVTCEWAATRSSTAFSTCTTTKATSTRWGECVPVQRVLGWRLWYLIGMSGGWKQDMYILFSGGGRGLESDSLKVSLTELVTGVKLMLCHQGANRINISNYYCCQ